MTIASDSQALAADILNHADASGFPKWKKGADLSSANALTLGSDGNAFDITGTTAITSISTRGVGAIILLHFDGALTLTHHSTNLVLPDGENITTAARENRKWQSRSELHKLVRILRIFSNNLAELWRITYPGET